MCRPTLIRLAPALRRMPIRRGGKARFAPRRATACGCAMSAGSAWPTTPRTVPAVRRRQAGRPERWVRAPVPAKQAGLLPAPSRPGCRSAWSGMPGVRPVAGWPRRQDCRCRLPRRAAHRLPAGRVGWVTFWSGRASAMSATPCTGPVAGPGLPPWPRRGRPSGCRNGQARRAGFPRGPRRHAGSRCVPARRRVAVQCVEGQ